MAPRRRQTIRKIQGSKVADFDEQLWPINCVILVLAGFLVGLILARGNFNTAETGLFDNGYVQLGLVGLLLGVLVWAVAWLQSRIARRVQLCILISLLLHLALAIYLHGHYLALLAKWESEKPRQMADLEEKITVPDYQFHHPDQLQIVQSFERPVETDVPDGYGPEPVERQPVEQEAPIGPSQPVEPETPEPRQATPAELRRAQLTAPRRAEVAAGAQISRQPWEHRLEPDEPVPMPEIRPAGREVRPRIQPQAAALRRQTARTPPLQRQTFDPPASSVQPREAVAPVRRTGQTGPTAEEPATPVPMRQVARPADVPHSEIEAPEPTERTGPPPVELESGPTVARRQLDLPGAAGAEEPPRASGLSAEPVTVRAQALAAWAATRRYAGNQEPELAPAPRVSSRELRPASVTAPTEVVETPLPAAAPRARAPAELRPAQSQEAWEVARASGVPDQLSARRTPADLAASGAGTGEPRLARVQPVLLPSAVAARSVRSQESAGPGPGKPSTLARADQGIRLPSTVAPAEGSTVPPVAGAGAPDRIDAAGSGGLVRRAADVSVERPDLSVAGGVAGTGSGPGHLVAQLGQLRTRDAVSPSVRYSEARQRSAEVSRPRRGRTTVGVGADLPSAMAAVEDVPNAGGASGPGAASNQADSLEAGPQVSVQRVAPVGTVGRTAAGVGAAESEIGSASVLPTARRALAGAEGPLTSDMARPAPRIERAAAALTALPGAGADIPERISEIGSGGGTAALPDFTGDPAIEGPERADDALAVAWRREGGGASVSAPGAPAPEAWISQAGRTDTPDVKSGAFPRSSPATKSGRSPMAGLAADVETEPGAPRGLGDARRGEIAPVAPEAGEIEQQREVVGLPGSLGRPAPPGAAPAAGPTSSTFGITSGPRRLPRDDREAPRLAARIGGGPVRKANAAGLPRSAAEVPEAELSTGAVVAPSGESAVPAGGDIGEPSRAEGGMQVDIAAAAGPGGLSFYPASVVGIPGRRARPESEVVHPTFQRFLVKRSGGRPAVDARVRQPSVDAFRQREPGRRAKLLEQFGATEASERAVEMGLDFLVRQQFRDGHWSLDQFPNGGRPEYQDAYPAQIRGDTAATGLALLAFLGAGYTHLDGKHRVAVRRGIEWLLANQQPDGQLFTIPTDADRAGRIYGHGIGAIALCEAYGMTRDPDLREPAERAIRFIVDAQHPTWGGWRYTKRDDQTTWRKESDTSVSGWQLMALKSAELAGLEVPPGVMEKVGRWLDLAQVDGGARYVYNPYASNTPDQRHGRQPNLAMTAEGLLMRLYLGWDRNHPAMIRGADYLKENLPDVGTYDHPLRDAYYWYYATQVMFQMQGEHWTAWNGRLRPMLETSQVDQGPLAGSWHPDRPVSDRWAHAGGRLYVTAMNLLMLEVYYRHLPLFQTLVPEATAGDS